MFRKRFAQRRSGTFPLSSFVRTANDKTTTWWRRHIRHIFNVRFEWKFRLTTTSERRKTFSLCGVCRVVKIRSNFSLELWASVDCLLMFVVRKIPCEMCFPFFPFSASLALSKQSTPKIENAFWLLQQTLNSILCTFRRGRESWLCYVLFEVVEWECANFHGRKL